MRSYNEEEIIVKFKSKEINFRNNWGVNRSYISMHSKIARCIFLDDSSFRVYSELLISAGGTKQCYPSRKRLMLIAQKSKNTLSEKLAILEKFGFIAINSRPNKITEYEINDLNDIPTIIHSEIILALTITSEYESAKDLIDEYKLSELCSVVNNSENPLDYIEDIHGWFKEKIVIDYDYFKNHTDIDISHLDNISAEDTKDFKDTIEDPEPESSSDSEFEEEIVEKPTLKRVAKINNNTDLSKRREGEEDKHTSKSKKGIVKYNNKNLNTWSKEDFIDYFKDRYNETTGLGRPLISEQERGMFSLVLKAKNSEVIKTQIDIFFEHKDLFEPLDLRTFSYSGNQNILNSFMMTGKFPDYVLNKHKPKMENKNDGGNLVPDDYVENIKKLMGG